MTVEPPWIKASQQGWTDRAYGPIPLWLSITCLAYSRVKATGHAPFQRGELSRTLGKSRQDIDRAIRTAVTKGWLLDESCSECLLPPGDFIEMSFGNSRERCTTHRYKKDQKRSDASVLVEASC